MRKKAHAYRGRTPADVVAELDADASAVKAVDAQLGLTTYTLDDDSLVEVTSRCVRSHSTYTAFCLGMV